MNLNHKQSLKAGNFETAKRFYTVCLDCFVDSFPIELILQAVETVCVNLHILQ